MNKDLLEAIKEAGRVVVLSIIPILVANLQEGRVDLKLIYVTAAIALLRAVDKWLHESASKTEDGLLGKKGLTGF